MNSRHRRSDSQFGLTLVPLFPVPVATAPFERVYATDGSRTCSIVCSPFRNPPRVLPCACLRSNSMRNNHARILLCLRAVRTTVFPERYQCTPPIFALFPSRYYNLLRLRSTIDCVCSRVSVCIYGWMGSKISDLCIGEDGRLSPCPSGYIVDGALPDRVYSGLFFLYTRNSRY